MTGPPFYCVNEKGNFSFFIVILRRRKKTSEKHHSGKLLKTGNCVTIDFGVY